MSDESHPSGAGSSELSTHASLLKKAEELKEKGNALFRAKEYKKAITRYSKIRAYTWQPDGEAAQYAGNRSQSAQFTDEEKASLVRLDQTANGNIAQCYLSLGDHRKCREYCVKVIGKTDYKSHPNPDLLVKALARAGQAALQANDLDASKDWVLKALDLDAKCGLARTTYRQLQEKYKAHNAQQRKQMAAAFQAA
ncbi:hypothetical protein CTAYLR_003723 [Chrysophaeum taylorii]|uniref:Tetratricopeptide repeat protein n=1 Tax=Chrysophaeum taylorii TaxID=2483200 RepID=A0AAD7UNX2_9STRA|nr:hypothetical protein CTAYLR_003723 [Chrysophaeum taylorii]